MKMVAPAVTSRANADSIPSRRSEISSSNRTEPTTNNFSSPFMVDPDAIARERIRVGRSDMAIAQHVQAETYMAPQIRVGTRETDDDEKCAPDSDAKQALSSQVFHGPGNVADPGGVA